MSVDSFENKNNHIKGFEFSFYLRQNENPNKLYDP